MDYQYDTLEQWVSETEDEANTDEEEKEWRRQQEDTLYELRRAGGHIMPVIKNPKWLDKMERGITGYHHWDRTNWIGNYWLWIFTALPASTLNALYLTLSMKIWFILTRKNVSG